MRSPVSRALVSSFTPIPCSFHRSRRFRSLGQALTSSVVVSSLGASISKTRRSGTPTRRHAPSMWHPSTPRTVFSASSESGGYSTFGSEGRRVTDTLLVLNVAVYGLQLLTGKVLLLYGAKINELILKGQIWRFLTSAFLHGDLLHLGFNCNALHQIGPLVEASSGHARFAAIYLGSAAAGGVLSFFMSPNMSIGASGAIFGIAGALAMFAWRHKQLMGSSADELLRRLGDAAALNFMYGLIVRRIDNWGHLGGLVGGAVLSYLLGPTLRPIFQNKRLVRIVDRPLLPIFATRRSRASK